MRDLLRLLQFGFTLAQHFLRALAFRDVARQRQAERTCSQRELANTNLDRENCSILAPMKSLEGYRFPGLYSLSDPRERCLVQRGIEVAWTHPDQLLPAATQA